MNIATQKNSQSVPLIIGDFITLFIFALLGITSHGNSVDMSALVRVGGLAWFGWFFVSPWFGLFDSQIAQNPKKVSLRVLIAWTLLGGPLFIILRSYFYDRPFIPSFIIVALSTSTILMLLWRVGFAWWLGRSN